MNRIDWFKSRYDNITTGFSTHEIPGNLFPGVIAVAKGGMIFEKHVNVEADTIKLNKYSCNPKQIKKWLEALNKAFIMCNPKNIEEYQITQQEKKSLSDLKRGVFAKRNLNKGDTFSEKDIFFAMPNSQGQMTSEYVSKHNKEFIALKNYQKNEAINEFKIGVKDIRAEISNIIHLVKSQLNMARIVLNKNSKIELSHHYGIEEFNKFGATIVNVINRDYCKKLIIQIPGQKHPKHYHVKKEESFQVLWGDLQVILDGKKRELKAGDIIHVEKKKVHAFGTKDGVIMEEISSTHFKDDSYYIDKNVNKLRKTNLKDWWLSI